MNTDELIKKSYDFAADLTKQMITLSTAIITLCVAFTDKLFTGESARQNSIWLLVSLIAFVISIAMGIFCLMGLTGQLGASAVPQRTEEGKVKGNDSSSNKELDIYNSTNRITSIIQAFTFVIGLVFAVLYIYKASITTSPDSQPATSVESGIHIVRHSTFSIMDSIQVDTLVAIKESNNKSQYFK